MTTTNITNRPSHMLLDAVYRNKDQDVADVLKTQEGEVSINHMENVGLTPLKGAILYNNFNIVELLLQMKADPNARGTKRKYALAPRDSVPQQKWNLYPKMYQVAQDINWGLPILLDPRSTPIQIAIKINDLPIINLLFHYGAIPEGLDRNDVPKSQCYPKVSKTIQNEYLKALVNVNTEKQTAKQNASAIKHEIERCQPFPEDVTQKIIEYQIQPCHLIDLPKSSKLFLEKYNPLAT